MIPVEFKMEPGTNIEAELEFYSKSMPWLKYLIDNSTNYHIDDYFEARTFQNIVRIKFNLLPAKETYYNLKYR
jgi:hypothetical protein